MSLARAKTPALPVYSADEIAAIGKWLAEGLTGAQIVGRMWTVFCRTVSRNAIIGLVRRNAALRAIGFSRAPNGLRQCDALPSGKPRRASDVGKRPAFNGYLMARDLAATIEGHEKDPDVPAFVPRPASALSGRVEAPIVRDAASRHVALVDLKHDECRFPVNDAAPGEMHLFCGMPAAAGRPYCRHHALRARAV